MPQNVGIFNSVQNGQKALGEGSLEEDSIRSYLRGYHFCREFT